MAEEESENDGIQPEEDSCDEKDGEATETECEDSGDETYDQGETQIVAQETEIDVANVVPNKDLARSREELADTSCCVGSVGVGGGNEGGRDDEYEPTQPTQVESPDGRSSATRASRTANVMAHEEHDSEATESQNPSSLEPLEDNRPEAMQTKRQQQSAWLASDAAGSAVTDTADRRRAPSPPRRAGRGSGVLLSGGRTAIGCGAAGGDYDGGASSGFLSSAEPSGKAARAHSARSLSSPQPLPEGCLDDQLNAAVAPVAGADQARSIKSAQRQHTTKEGDGGGSSTADAFPVTQAKNSSPANAVADPGGWIQTKGGGKARLPPTATAQEHGEPAAALDTQEGPVSQSFLVIGVPHERRVLGAAAAAHEDEDEDSEMPADGVIGGTVNSQELKAVDFPQIREDCSQERNEFDRFLDEEIAGAAATPGEGTFDKEEESPLPPLDRGASISGKRKKMRTSLQISAEDGDEGRKGDSGSRTPGAYMGGSGSKSSSKKRKAPSCLPSANQEVITVFDMTSDDDDSDGQVEVLVRSTKPKPGRQRAFNSGGSTNRGGKTRHKEKAKNPAGVPVAARRAAADGGDHEEEEEEGDSIAAGVRDVHDDGDDDDDDADDADQVVTTQERRIENTMAAIRKETTPASAEDGEEEGQKEEGWGEDEGRGEEEEMGVLAEGDEEKEGEEQGAGGGEGTASAVGGRERIVEASNTFDATDGGPTPCLPEWLTYKELKNFLFESEGWACVVGKGLHTWFYLVPGKMGRSGTYGVDYLVTEEEVVRYVRYDKQTLARYDAYRQRSAAAKDALPSTSDSARIGAAGERADDSRPGGNGANRGHRGGRDFIGPTSGHGEKIAGGKAIAGSSAEVNGDSSAEPGAICGAGSAAGPTAARGQTSRGRGRGSGQAGERRQAERPAARESSPDVARTSSRSGAAKTARSAPAQRQTSRGRILGSDQAGGQGHDGEQAGQRRLQGTVEENQKWLEWWSKLSNEGWRWEYGKGQMDGCIYLKPGFTKKTGTVGVSMFISRQSVLEHVLESAPEAAEPPVDAVEPPAQNGNSDAATESSDRGSHVEWSLARYRVPRPRNRPGSMPPADLPPVEAMDLPRRGDGRKSSRLTPAPTTQGGGSSSAGPSTGKSAGRGGGRPAGPRARGGRKRGRGRPPKAPEGGAGRVGRTNSRGDADDEQGRAMENGQNSEDDEDWDNVDTQPQNELVSAITMAEVGNGAWSPTVANGAAATAAALRVGNGAEGGKGTLGRFAGAMGEPTSTMQEVSGAREGGSQHPQGSGSTSRPAHGSPTACGDNGSGDVFEGTEDRTPKRKASADSPLKSSSSSQGGGGGGATKKQRSPSASNGARSSTRRITAEPFSGLGVIITGLRGDSWAECEANIAKLGGKVVNVIGQDRYDGDDPGWRRWLVDRDRPSVAGEGEPNVVVTACTRTSNERGSSEARTTPGGGSSTPQRRMIAVATPDSDRTPKFQLAMAAGMPIVHPSYVSACSSMVTEVKTDGYLLPLGRSALGDRGPIMPFHSARGRPFQGKNIIFCTEGLCGGRTALKNWVFTFTVAGANVKVLQGAKESAGGCGADNASWCNLEAALDLIKDGQIFCVIGDRITGVGSLPASTAAVEKVAETMGTPAGSLEWATQCIAHGRLLLPNAGTCPWFPLVASGGSDTVNGGGRTSGEADLFYVNVTDGKRFVAGDYVFLREKKSGEKKIAGVDSRGATEAGAGARAAARAGAAGTADISRRVVRVISFRREADGKVRARVTAMKRSDNAKVLVAPGGEEDDTDDDEEEEVGEKMLGDRVLLFTQTEMQVTSLYSLNDSGIFCLTQ